MENITISHCQTMIHKDGDKYKFERGGSRSCQQCDFENIVSMCKIAPCGIDNPRNDNQKGFFKRLTKKYI